MNEKSYSPVVLLDLADRSIDRVKTQAKFHEQEAKYLRKVAAELNREIAKIKRVIYEEVNAKPKASKRTSKIIVCSRRKK